MKKRILIILTTILFVLTAVFSFIYLNRLKMNYNSEGNYFNENPGVVYHQQAVIIWGIIALVLFFLTVLTAWKLKKNIFSNDREAIKRNDALQNKE